MPSYKDFKLPDLGEGLTEGEILKWLVQPGDQVTLNQPIVEVETAKAAVEIPSPYAGVVTQLHHAEGETVDVGSPIITFDTDPSGEVPQVDAGGGQSRVAAAADMVPQVPAEPGIAGGPAPKANTEEKIEVLVGSGPKSGKLTRRPRKADVASASSAVTATPAAPARPAVEEIHVLAKPPVRTLAS